MHNRLCLPLLLILSFAGSVVFGCGKPANKLDAAKLHEIASPAAEGSAQANLTTGPGGETYLSWMETNDAGWPALKFALKSPAGWTGVRTITEGDGLVVNYADFPSLLAIDKNNFAAHWMTAIPNEGEGYNVNVALSHDGGQTWTKPVVPNRDGTPTEHGFVSLAPLASGGIAAIWLDSRKLEKESTDVALMTAAISNEGVAGPESAVDERVCECCQTSSVAVNGGILTVYRDRTKEEIRDIAIVRFDGKQWSSPKIVSNDNWMIDACPINGPAIAAKGNDVVVAWFTVVNDKSRVKAAFSTDGGNTFGKPLQVDDGDPIGRVDVVMLDSGKAVVSWLEKKEKVAELRAKQVQADGTSLPAITIGTTSAGTASGFPRMELSQGTLTFAWTDSVQKKVRTSDLKLSD
jgi:hypothetical protein